MKIIFQVYFVINICLFASLCATAVPIADAGPDIYVTIGSKVTLDGSKSYSSNGNTLSYIWNQISGPGRHVVLTSSTSIRCSFIAERMDYLYFKLFVTDLQDNVSSDVVKVVVNYPDSLSPVELNTYPLLAGCTWEYNAEDVIGNELRTGYLKEEIISTIVVGGRSCYEVHSYTKIDTQSESNYGELYKCINIENNSLKCIADFSPISAGAGVSILSTNLKQKRYNKYVEVNRVLTGLKVKDDYFSKYGFNIDPGSYTIKDSPVIYLTFPTTLGKQWTRCYAEGLGYSTSTITGFKMVAVPAWTFYCVEVKTDWFGMELIEWYSNIGLVKRYVSFGIFSDSDYGGMLNWELSSYLFPGEYIPPSIIDQTTDINPVVYPNPFNISSGKSISFKYLKPDSKPVIYTISGKLVKVLPNANAYGMTFWNGDNENNNIVAQGIYLFAGQNPSGKKKTGKIAVKKSNQ